MRNLGIMVVNDNAFNRAPARPMFRAAGASLPTVRLGQAVLDAEGGEIFDLMLMDARSQVARR